MPLFQSPYGNLGSSKRTGYWNQPGGGGSVVQADDGQPATHASDPLNGPGSIDFDLTDPQAAIEKAGQETNDIWTGLKSFIFGTSKPDPKGDRGGVFGIGNTPIGDVGRGAMEVVKVPLDLVGGAVDLVGDSLRHIPSGMSDAQKQSIIEQFNAIPDNAPMKEDALKLLDTEKGETPQLSYMSEAIKQWQQSNGSTDLMNGLFAPAPSIGDAFGNLLGLLGAGQRIVERGIAGAGRPGTGGLNQLQMVMAVGDGHATWTSDDPGLTPVEQQAYDNVTSGAWTEDQALNFLASHGAGLSHNKALEIAGTFATDPLTIGSLGAGALAGLGRTGVTLLNIQRDATGLLEAERALGAAADVKKIEQLEHAVELAGKGIKSADASAGKNALAAIAKQKWTGSLARKYGLAYEALEGTQIGQMAKIARTVIDPLHQWGGKPHIEEAIDEGSRQVAQAVVKAHGEFTNIDTIHHLAGVEGVGMNLVDEYTRGLAVYSGNVLRRIASRRYRAVQMLADKAEQLVGEDVHMFDAIKDAMANVKKRAMTQMQEEATRFIKRGWSQEDKENLAERLATLWGGRTKEEWIADFAGKHWSPEKMSLLHSASYGTAVRQLHDARALVRASGEAGTFTDRLHRLVLINKQTLTDLGAEGILDRLEAATSMDAKMAVIESAKADYPELRNFVTDPNYAPDTISEFIQMIERRKNFLPAQIRDAERTGLPSGLAEFDAKTRNVFTIGFRPDDEFLWGLERDSNGVLREVGDPWFDQVSDNLQGYMPVRSPSFNVAGKPIVGKIVGSATRMIDAAEAAGRVAMNGVTGTMVETAAHARFTESVASKYGASGLSRTQAEAIWKALMNKVDDSENISGIRGLSRDSIWNAAKEVIPSYAERAGLDRRALLVHVLEAYDGDLRHIGLTQKFTGKAKLLAAQLTGANTAGVISEHMWPLMKFRLNAFFQLQEKIEPWVLNAQRGITPARGVVMNETDKLTASLYRNFVDKNLINMADNDIAELARKMGWGKGMDLAGKQEGGKLAFIRSKMETWTEVQGVKQLNMLRTWGKGLGREMKGVWDQNLPGEWDKMLAHARAMAGTAIDEDEFAVRLAAENLAANDITIRMVRDAAGNVTSVEADFEHAITTGQWAAPQSLGELRALELDHIISRAGLRDSAGADISNAMQMREALADRRIHIDDLKRTLRDLHAHPDYIQRVEAAFNFSWRQFWTDAEEAFSLTPAESRGMQSMFATIAQNRGMSPVEYMSQVYSPVIANRGEHAVGSLGNLVEFTRGARTESLPDLAHLVGAQGQATVNDLYRQLGAIMAQHLDPSAKRAFLLDINPALAAEARNGNILTGLDEIEAMFDSNATDALSDRIMHFVMGQPGTGAHALVADEATGVAAIRNAATEWRAQAGRPRNMQRVVYEDNPALSAEVAEAFDALPRTWAQVATPEKLAEKVELADVVNEARNGAGVHSMKAEAAALSKPVRNSYEAYQTESRKMFRYLTETAGIEVKPVRAAKPYATADALRADLARGRLKVPQAGYWHPIFHTEDLFMQRAVQDAFGFGQEATAFGSHDAVFSAGAMYSDEARAVYESDNFGRAAWEAHSPEVIPAPVAEPTNVAEYEARWGRSAQRPTPTTNIIGTRLVSRSLGNGVRALPEPVQQELVTALGALRNQFPSVPLEAVDVGAIPAGSHAVTADSGLEGVTIVLSPDAGWQADDALRTATRERRLAMRRDEDILISTGAQDVHEFVSATPVGDLYHEYGHVLDLHLHNQYGVAHGGPQAGFYVHEPLADLIDQFRQGPAAMVSGYATTQTAHSVMPQAEAFAELFDLAFNPEHTDIILNGALDPQVESYVNAFRKELKNAGVWMPDGGPVPANPLAGQTVAAANAAAPGAVRAEHRVGLIPQELRDRLTENFLGSGRYAESNPDVARMAAYLHEHMQSMTAHVLRHGEAGDIGNIFTHMSGMPVKDAAPFNLTEARLWDAAAQSMASKWEDAFRLQYFAQSRSMFQRSLNHPMFGLYPASYMWGKIGPELIRFIAKEPFGMNTGAMAYALSDFQKGVAVQRQYDPEFDAFMDELGANPLMTFLGYMLPATPWSVPASFPGWARDMAEQGLDNEDSVNNGGYVEKDDFISPLQSVVKKIVPYTTTVPWFGRALDALPFNADEEEPAAPGVDAMGNPTSVAPPAEKPDLSQPTAGLGLGVVLETQMRDLQSLLR